MGWKKKNVYGRELGKKTIERGEIHHHYASSFGIKIQIIFRNGRGAFVGRESMKYSYERSNRVVTERRLRANEPWCQCWGEQILERKRGDRANFLFSRSKKKS